MKKRIILNEERDHKILAYIWFWKVATTEAIYRKFFSHQNPKTVYNRLSKLKRHGFLEIRITNNGTITVWTLGKRGFETIKELLPALKEEGYKSENIKHDLFASAAHQGDFLKDKPSHIENFTEQELRRYDPDYIPSWVPSVELHRPDGYWLIKNESKGDIVMSLELERTRKNSAAYEKLANFYADFPEKDRVLWIVEGHGLIKFISNIMSKDYDSKKIHNYVLLKDFLEFGWSSKILKGVNQGETISNIFYSDGCAMPMRSQLRGTHKSLLNTKLKHCDS